MLEAIISISFFIYQLVNADSCVTTECYDHGSCVNDTSSTGYTCTCDENYAGSDCQYYMNTKEASAELIFIIMGSILFAPGVVLFCTCYKKLAGIEDDMLDDDKPSVKFSRGTITTDVYLKARSLVDMRDSYRPGGFKEAHSAIW